MIHATMITSIAVIMIFAILAINHSVILIISHLLHTTMPEGVHPVSLN